MSEQLNTQLKKIQHASPLLRKQATFGVFQLIKRLPSTAKDAAAAAIATCLARHDCAAVVDEAATQLVAWVTAAATSPQQHLRQGLCLSPNEAIDMLLAAMPSASSATAPLLAQALVVLVHAMANHQLSLAAAAPGQSGWGAHPFSAALAAHSGTAPVLLAGVTRLLAEAADADGASRASVDAAWAALEPFLSVVMLAGAASAAASRHEHAAAEAAAALRPTLCAALVRLAAASCGADCGGGSGWMALEARVLLFLVACMMTGGLGDESARLEAGSCLSDLCDLLEGQEEGPSWQQHCCSVAAAAVCLCARLLAAGHSLAGCLPAMQRLAALEPVAFAHQLAQLSGLAAHAAATQDRLGLAALLASSCTAAPLPAATAALLLPPCLEDLVLSTTAGPKAWAAQLMRQALAAQPAAAVTIAAPPATWPVLRLAAQGRLAWVGQCSSLLAQLWATEPLAPRGAVCWLCAVRCAVAAVRDDVAAAAAASLLRADDPVSEGAMVAALSPGGSVVAALLLHPSPQVVAAAAAALRELLLAAPLLAVPVLPVLLHALQRLQGACKSGGLEVARTQMALLGVLPAMCGDAATAPLALRALQPLTAPSAPPLLRCLALRLSVEAWQLTGRGWQRAEAAINGYAPPTAGMTPPLPLRLARTAIIREVCASEPHKALELVAALQEALSEGAPRAVRAASAANIGAAVGSSPVVAALALDALRELCAADTIDWYSGWQVVAAAHPTLPQQPQGKTDGDARGRVLLAVAWVRLLAGGAYDAAAHPGKAAAIVELLWAATEDDAPEVRGAAYASLAAFPPELVEALGLEVPLCDFVAPLLEEPEGSEEEEGAQREEGGLAAALAGLTLHASGSAALEPAGAAAQQQPLRGAAAARRGAEALAAVALAHEHAHRRSFLASAPTARSAAAAGGGGGRDAAALLHRLVSVVPPLVVASGMGAAAAAPSNSGQRQAPAPAASTAPAGPAPGALLLCWRPPTASAVPASRGGRAGGAAPGAAPAAYRSMFIDISSRQRWSSWTHPGLAAAAWTAFMGRWLAAAGAAPEPLLQELRRCCAQGVPAAAAGAALAMGGLAAAGGLGEAEAAEVVGELAGLLQAPGRPSAVAQAAAAALAAAAPALHPADATTRAAMLAALHEAVLDHPSGAVRAAAAGATAAIACQLLRQGAHANPRGTAQAAASSPEVDMSCEAAALLLGVACAASPAHAAALQDAFAAAAAPLGAQAAAVLRTPQRVRLPAADVAAGGAVSELLPTLWPGLAAVACALSQSGGGDAAAGAMWRLAAGCVQRLAGGQAAAAGAQASAAAEQAGLLAALPEVAASCSTSDMQALVAALSQLVEGADSVDGRLRGLAATSWAALVGRLLTQPGAEVQALAQPLVGCLTRLASDPGKGPAAGELRQGAIAAMGQLLRLGAAAPEEGRPGSISISSDGGEGVPLWQQGVPGVAAARALMRTLEAVAVRERDGRGAAAAAWQLAAASAAARTAGTAAGIPGAGSGSDGAAALAPLSAYPPDSAMRALVERLLAAVAPSSPDPLGPGQAAAMLRVLSRCPRLPAADWAALCRVLSAGAPPGPAGLELHSALAALVLAHGPSPATGLSSVRAGWLLPHQFAQLALQLQAALLNEAPRALACLPANRVASALRALPALACAAATAAADPAASSAVLAAAWRGLGRVAAAAAGGSALMVAKGVQAALASALGELYAQLQPLGALLPGEIAALLAEQQVLDGGGGGGSGGGGNGSTLARAQFVWAAALAALRLHPQTALQLTALPAVGAVAAGDASSLGAQAVAVQMRCLLLQCGTLGAGALVSCTSAAIDAPPPASSSSSSSSSTDALAGEHLQRLLPFVALSVAAQPPSDQVARLHEVLAAAQLAPSPCNALLLAAAVVAASLASNSGAQHGRSAAGKHGVAAAAAASVDLAVSLSSAEACLACLPATLQTLMLSQPQWAASCDALAADLLASLALPGVPQWVAVPLVTSLVTLREQLHGGTWDAVSEHWRRWLQQVPSC